MPDLLFFAEMPDVSLRSWNMGALSILFPRWPQVQNTVCQSVPRLCILQNTNYVT